MKLPFLSEYTLSRLSCNASKLLMFLASAQGHRRGNVYRSASRLQWSSPTWRRAMSELVEARLATYEWTTAGYRVRLRAGRRFTWAPGYDDRRIEMASPRACKALLVLCRCLDNRTRTTRVRLDTIAARMGSCRRIAQMAVSELRDRNIVGSARTGRSCWWWVLKPDPAAPMSLAPRHAHRSDLLVRLLSSTSASDLSRACTTARRNIASTIQRAISQMRPCAMEGAHKSFVLNRLVEAGVRKVEATRMAICYSVNELTTALALLLYRRPRDKTRFLQRALESGWCAC